MNQESKDKIIQEIKSKQETQTSSLEFEKSYSRFIHQHLKEINKALRLSAPDQSKKQNKNKKNTGEIADTRLSRLNRLLSKNNLQNHQISVLFDSLRRELDPVAGPELFEQPIIVEFLENLYEIFEAAFLNGSPEIIASLHRVYLEQESKFSGSLDLLSFVKLIVYFSTNKELVDQAGSISAAIMAMNNRHIGMSLSNSGELSTPLVKQLELSIKVSILADALKLRHPATPAYHADPKRRYDDTPNDDIKGIALFAFISEFENSLDEDFPASYFLTLSGANSNLFRQVIKYESETWMRAIQAQGRYNAVPATIEEGPGLIWWEKDPLRSMPSTKKVGARRISESSSVVEVKKPKDPQRLLKEISEILKKHLLNKENQTDLVPEFFDAWWRFNIPEIPSKKTLEQLKMEANPGLHPTTKRGEIYWFKNNYEKQKKLIESGLLGLQFRLIESDEDNSGHNDQIEVVFLMEGNKKFSFSLNRDLSISDLPEFFADQEDKILSLVLSVLGKIRNRQIPDSSGNLKQDIGSGEERSGANNSRDDLPAHIRMLIGKAPNREWLNESSDLNAIVKRKYGLTLKELNLHFAMVQILGKDYFESLPEDGVKNLVRLFIEKKLAMTRIMIASTLLFGVSHYSVFEFSQLNLSRNAEQTHQIMRDILEKEIPRDLALLTFVQTQDSANLSPRTIDSENIFDEADNST